MYLIAIFLTAVLPVASATPVFPIVKPFISHNLARAIAVPTQPDLPTDTVIAGPIPSKWRHTHGPLSHDIPIDTGLVYKSDQPVDVIGARRRLARAINDDSNAGIKSNTEDIVPISPKLKILLPPPPMTNVQICQALCSMYDAKPCGPCEDVSNSPDAITPPPNAETTTIVTARGFTTIQDKAWLPLWRCLIECIGERYSQCQMCYEYWTFYQSTLPPTVYKDPEMKDYIEMTKCLTACGGGLYGPACFRCDKLWSAWERDLSPYVGPRGLVTAGGMVKREPFRGNIISLTLFGCLKGCDPERPVNSQETCTRCRKMVSVVPPVLLHNWATERLTIKPEYYNPLTTGPAGSGH